MDVFIIYIKDPMLKHFFNAKIIFRLLRDFVFVYLGVFGVSFFYYQQDYSDFMNNLLKLSAITVSVLIYCRGVIGVIQDVRQGAFRVVWKWLKGLINVR